MKRNSFQGLMVVLLVGGLAVSFSTAEESATKSLPSIPQPKGDVFITDVLDILDPINEREINGALNALQEETGVTLYVVLLPSMEVVGYPGTLENLAADLMKQWDVSPKTLNGKPWDKGVMFLLSQDEKLYKIRIETGGGWGTDLDEPATAILGREIYPYLNRQKYTIGIKKGIISLAAAIRMQSEVKRIPPKIITPKDEDFAVDTANLFPLEANLLYNKLCKQIYVDYGVPVFIVTAPSIESVSRKGLNFDSVADRFFLSWPVTPAGRRTAFQDNGVLIFLSPEDNVIGVKIKGKVSEAKVRENLREKIQERLMQSAQDRQLPQGIADSLQMIQKALQEGKLSKASTLNLTPTAAPAVAPAAAPATPAPPAPATPVPAAGAK